MEQTRSATATWQGDLASGSGKVSGGTGLFRDLPVSWTARTEEPGGQTSPEELLAAAHASCFNMALSGNVARAGHRAESLRTTAAVSFTKVGDGWSVSRSELTVRGRVPGMDEAAFLEAANGAKDGCPISRALAGNVELSVDATLES